MSGDPVPGEPKAVPGRLNWGTVLGDIIRNWVRNLVRSLPLMVLLFGFSILLHTFLLVYYNEGFGAGTFLGAQLLNVQSMGISSTILWTLVSGFLFGLIPLLIRRGPGALFSEMRGLPGQTIRFVSESAVDGLQFFLTGLGLTLIFASIMSGAANLVLAAGLAAVFALPLGRVLATLIQSTWTAVLQAVRPELAVHLAQYGMIPGYTMIMGLAAGFALGIILPYEWIFGVLAMFVAVVLVFARQLPPAGAMRVLLLIVVTGCTLLKARGVLADDGGWVEGGGNFISWIQSQGALEAILRGLGPSLGAALGPSIFNALMSLGLMDFSPDAGSDNLEPDKVSGPASFPFLFGGPSSNPFTQFFSGKGPGDCYHFGLPNYWVNTATLNLVIQDTVFAYSGLGPQVRLIQTCKSDPGEAGMFGPGWRFSYESAVEQRGRLLILTLGTGQKIRYQQGSNPGTLEQPAEAVCLDSSRDRLLDNGASWLYIEKRSRLVYRYDRIPGRMVSLLNTVQDAHGNQVQLAYNSQDGSLASITDAAGRTTRFSYNGHLCTSFVTPDGRQAVYAYSQGGRLVQATDLEGIVTDYEYNPEGYLVKMTVGRERRSYTFSYNSGQDGATVAAVTDAGGGTTRFEVLPGRTRQVRVIDAEGQSTIFSSKDGYTETVINPLGQSLACAYEKGLLVSATDPIGQTWRYEYDTRGNLTRSTDPAGAVTQQVYDREDRLCRIINPRGESWTYSYDQRCNLTEMRTPMGRVTAIAYNALGLIEQMTSPAGHKTNLYYDRFGNLERIAYPTGSEMRFSYDDSGLTNTGMNDADGNRITFAFDNNNRLTRLVHPDGNAVNFGYDCCAGIFTTDENGFSQAYERDAQLNITRYHDAAGNVSSFSYDRLSRMTASRDPGGGERAFQYDRAGRLIRFLDALGQATEYAYDAAGNLIAVTPPGGARTEWAYNHNREIVRITDPASQATVYNRDALGRIAEIVNARGSQYRLEYTQDSQPGAKYYGTTQVSSYEYDQDGNMSMVKDLSGSLALTWNAARQLEKIQYSNGLHAEMAYSPGGCLASLTCPGGLKVEYRYDSRQRLASMKWGSQAIEFVYDASGCLVEEKRSNGWISACEVDANRRLRSLKHYRGAEVLADLSYVYDPDGSLLEESGMRRRLSGRASSAQGAGAGRCNLLNQLISWDEEQYTYDADGNLTHIQGGRDFSAVYDPENRMIKRTTGGKSTNYYYNGLDQRVRVEKEGQAQFFHYSLDGRLLFISDTHGHVISRFLYAGRKLAAMIGPDGRTCFYHFNHLGSVTALTDENGAVAAEYDYAPYGEVIAREEKVAGNPFTFAGAWGVMDDGDSLFFMKKRYYDSRTGRFMQKDPLGLNGGLNLYAYAAGNPVNRIDPQGTNPLLVLIAIVSGGIVVASNIDRSVTHIVEGNVVPKVLTTSAQTQDSAKIKEAHGPDPQKSYFFDPEHGVINIPAVVIDKVLSLHPETGGAWAVVKTITNLTRGNLEEAAYNSLETLPGGRGQFANFFNEYREFVKNNAKAPCSNP